jgi:hypothetical protein
VAQGEGPEFKPQYWKNFFFFLRLGMALRQAKIKESLGFIELNIAIQIDHLAQNHPRPTPLTDYW